MNPIKPSHINTDQHFWGAFDRYETEVGAAWVVLLLQQENEWRPFTDAEMQRYYNETWPEKKLDLSDLVEGGWLREENGVYTVTNEFVARCYGASPCV
jgi:hypothetical protein